MKLQLIYENDEIKKITQGTNSLKFYISNFDSKGEMKLNYSRIFDIEFNNSFYGSIIDLPSSYVVSRVDTSSRSITLDSQTSDSHYHHVRAYQEEINRNLARQARNEMERRLEQAAAEALRLEEERNRPRRPWERFRDMFR